MEIWDELLRYFSDAGSTRRLVILGTTLLGIAGGIIGTFAVLRRQSLLGDAMAHAALPGVCLAFLLTGYKNTVVFMLGAILTALTAAFMIVWITTKSRIKEDTAIGLTLSWFFGIGIVLLTVIQTQGNGGQAGLDSFLFGKAASLLPLDVQMMAGLCLLLVAVVAAFYKEFKLLSFDPAFGSSIGMHIRGLNYFLTGLMVVTVMIGLQAVGVVLMVAMLILPAAAARQWTDRLGVMLLLSATFGAVAGVAGALFSSLAPKIPTGPVMVLSGTAIVLFSLLFAPRRGVFSKLWHKMLQQRQIAIDHALKNIYKILWTPMMPEQAFLSKDNVHPLSQSLVQQKAKITDAMMAKLVQMGMLTIQNGIVQMTPAGVNHAATILRRHRLWEAYLHSKMAIASDHLHRDADDVEHILTPELTEEISSALQGQNQDPHGQPIPSNGQLTTTSIQHDVTQEPNL